MDQFMEMSKNQSISTDFFRASQGKANLPLD
jgi:hypothetical protein